MDKQPVGTRIRIIGNSNHHHYSVGEVYTISIVDDNDGTLQAADASGNTKDWLRWCDCEMAGDRTWDVLAKDLPEEMILFLSAFDGIGALKLKESVIDTILLRLPDLNERIVAVCQTPEGRAIIARNLPRHLAADGGR